MSIMDEDKKVVLPELPKPSADEKPEEGFVPYCGSKEAKQLEKMWAKGQAPWKVWAD